MKFKEYLAGLNQLAEEHPETLKMEAFYASDDEGNGYQQVNSNGTIVIFENPKKYYPELIDTFDGTNIKKCNGVIIN